MLMSTIAEYVWIDSVGELRSKSRTIWSSFIELKLSDIPNWNFDGSYTGQASGSDSEVTIVPRAVFRDPFKKEAFLVMTDCYDSNMNPIPTNTRSNAYKVLDKVKNEYPLFELEQEYVIYDCKTERPIGWPDDGSDPEPQGKYYCGVGGDRAFGREIANEHYMACYQAGIRISDINAEVMPGQWKYKIGPCEGIEAGDHLWMARYIMDRIAEKYIMKITLDPKPESGDWNSSGCHTIYSTLSMRSNGGDTYIYQAIEKLANKHKEHIAVYGNNEKRLTGKHKTSDISTFSYGIANKGASVRIPSVVEKEGKGYLEDRRPSSDCDPYLVTSIIVETTLSKYF